MDGSERKRKSQQNWWARNVLTVEEVAAYLRVHKSTIYRLARKGKLPAFRLGDIWRFNIEDVDMWRLKSAKGKRVTGEAKQQKK